MYEKLTCDQCGRNFENKNLLKGFRLAKLGKDYCSDGCKNAAEKAKKEKTNPASDHNSSSENRRNDNNNAAPNVSVDESTTVINNAPGFGHFVGKAFGDTINKTLSVSDKLDQQDREKAAKIEDLAQMKMAANNEDLLEQLNYLASLASSKPDKQIKNVIIEKMEFGIMKLKSNGAAGEADFFEKKLEPLKKKGWF